MEVCDLEVKIKELRGKQKIIEDLNQKRSGPVLVMESLSQATPASLWLTDLREAGGTVGMNGLALDHEAVSNFMRSLAGSKHFSNIELVETVQGTGPISAYKKFTVQARVNHRSPDEPPDSGKDKPRAAASEEKKQ